MIVRERLEKLLKEFDEYDSNDLYQSQEYVSKELADVIAGLQENVGYTELYHIVKNMDNRLQRIEDMVEGVAKEIGPIVAELADSPFIKMLTGGKKRV